MQLESSESSDSAFGGRRRSKKVRERFAVVSAGSGDDSAAEAAEEARAILQHWRFEGQKKKSAKLLKVAEKLLPKQSHKSTGLVALAHAADASAAAPATILEEPELAEAMTPAGYPTREGTIEISASGW